MMAISEAEVVGLLQFAVRRTATKLGCEDVEWKSISELLEEIHARDEATHGILMSFIDAYMDWFRFHQHIDKTGKQGKLDADENAELVKRVQNRNATRNAILERLKHIG